MSDHLQVCFALVGDSAEPFDRTASEEEWGRPYAERQKVMLDVSPQETLAEVIERAARAMGLAPPDEGWKWRGASSKIAFYRPEDEHGFSPRAVPRFLLGQLTLVDEQGRAIFGVHDFRAIKYGDLLRAADAGTLDGDPLRPYLIIEPPYGDWIGPDWPTLLEGLRVAWDIIEHLATAGGAAAAGKFAWDQMKKRLGRGADSIEANREWAQRGTMPYEFIALASVREWRTPELARLLGCAERELEGVLPVLGFGLDADRQVWVYSGDETAEVIAVIFEQIQYAAHMDGDDPQADLRERLRTYFVSGEPPRNPGYGDWDDDDYNYRPTAGERISDAGQRIGDAVDNAIEFARGVRRAWEQRRDRPHS